MELSLNFILQSIFFLIIIFSIYKWSILNYNFFKKRNIIYETPVPYFGNLAKPFFRKVSFFDNLVNFCNKFRNERIFGFFEFRNPLFVINDPDLIKQIMVRDFDHFVNHRTILEGEIEPLFGYSLLSLKDQKWRDMRATLSPAFTGSKIRQMFCLIEEVSRCAVCHLKEECMKNNSLLLDVKEFCTRFTNDIIASTAFGIKINSLSEKDNEFYNMGKKATNFTLWTSIKLILMTTFHSIAKFFKIKLFDEKFSKYFRHLVLNTIKYRTDHGIVRPDMINLLIEARKGVLKHDDNHTHYDEGFAATQESAVGLRTHNRNWSDDEIVAQCFLFFVAGFETTSLLICFCIQELMENTEVQANLIQEIDELKAELNGQPLTYGDLNKLKYLDMVMSETLRKWPPVVATDRVCVKSSILRDNYNGQDIRINIGDNIWIPVVGLHYNPDYYEKPKKFDPQRFSAENLSDIKPFTYLPFGAGPRNCIGSRFALMNSKVLIFQLLSEFTFTVSHKTQLPTVLDTSGFQMHPKGGFWTVLKPRQ